VLAEPQRKVAAAGGFIAQPLPTITENELEALEGDIAKMPGISGLMGRDLTAREILERLFPSLPVTIMETGEVKLTCDCSKEKLSRALLTIGEEDLREILEVDGQAELHCHFCAKVYHFDEDELRALYEESRRK